MANLSGEPLTEAAKADIATAAAQRAQSAGLSRATEKNIADLAAKESERRFMEEMSTTDRLGKLASNFVSGDTVQAVADNYLPIALGGGSLAAQNAQDRYLQDMDMMRAEREKRKKEMYAKYPEIMV